MSKAWLHCGRDALTNFSNVWTVAGLHAWIARIRIILIQKAPDGIFCVANPNRRDKCPAACAPWRPSHAGARKLHTKSLPTPQRLEGAHQG